MQIDYDRAKKINGYMEKMQRENELNSKNGIWKWNEIGLAAMYIEDAIRTNKDDADVIESISYWIALRLKFTTDEIETLVKNFLAGKKDYTYVLYGRTIFDWMQKNSKPYIEAILIAYFISADKDEVDKYGDYYPTSCRSYELGRAELDADGKTIIYHEYKGIYGDLSEEEKIQRKKEIEDSAQDIIVRGMKEMAKRKGMTYEDYMKLVEGDNYEKHDNISRN